MKRIERIKVFILRHERFIVLMLIAIGALSRFLFLGSQPPGLNQDEASAGYEAWSLLHYGVDRNGMSWPVLFISWGSGQNVLYSYLSIPFIALFGLNEITVRVVASIFGTLTLPVFYFLTKKIRGQAAAVIALFVLSLNPWHIMVSRWGLESNLLPFFLLLGIYFTVSALEKPRFLIAAGAVFALSLYAYGTAYLFLPVFLLCSCLYLLFAYRKEKRIISLRIFLLSLSVFIIIALPITLCNVINLLGLPEINVLGITLPRLTQTRQTATTAIGTGLSGYLDHFNAFLTLLTSQSDGLPFNSIPGYMFAPLFLPLSALGILFSVYEAVRRRLPKGEVFMLFAILAAAGSSFVITVNINRINMAFLPLIWFSAVGLWHLLKIILRFIGGNACLIAAAGASLLLLYGFAHSAYTYGTTTREKLSDQFFEGLGAAIQYAEMQNAETIKITYYVNAPYIYVLFYNQIPPEAFYETVEYLNPGGDFCFVSRFSKYTFGDTSSGEDAVLILNKSEVGSHQVLAEFGNYVVCR